MLREYEKEMATPPLLCNHCKFIPPDFPAEGQIYNAVTTGQYIYLFIDRTLCFPEFCAVKDCTLLTEDEKRFHVSLMFTEQRLSSSSEELRHAGCRDQAKNPKCKSEFVPIISNAEIAGCLPSFSVSI